MDPAHKALARKVLFGVGGLTLVGAVGAGIYNAVVDRPPKFARVVAKDLPADSVGMVAFADPAHALELVEEAIPAEVRAELEKELGFDPFSPSSYAEQGFDVEAPIGLAMTDIDREVFVFTMGITDADVARETVREYADKTKIGEWQDREFAGIDGLWMAEPPAAMLFRDDRLILVATEDDHDKAAVEAVAEEIAELRDRDSLATTHSFRSIHRFPGDPIMLGYVNAAELGDTMAARATIGSTEVETMAFALTSDARDIHFVWQTVVSKDSEYLEYVNGRDRSLKALDSVPGPVYAGFHVSVDPEYVRRLFDDLGQFGKDALDEAEQETERELGVSFAQDILGAWTGEFGVLWTGAGEGRWGGLAFVGVRDEAAAEATLETVWSRTDGDDRRSTDAGTVFGWDEKPPASAKIWDDYAWFGLGESRIDEVDDDAKGFRKTTEVDAIADVVGDGSMSVGFVDLVELRKLLRELPEAKDIERYTDVLDELEALTMHATVDGQTFTWTTTLHTTVDDAFDTLIQRLLVDLVEDEGDTLFDELIPRKAECKAAVYNIVLFTSWETPNMDEHATESLRAEKLAACERGEFDAKCASAATSMQELERCGITP